MNRHLFRAILAGLAALAPLLVTPTTAHQGLLHDGCPAGQVFSSGDLEISGAFTRATLPAAKTAGGYLTIENHGAIADRLLGGATEAAAAVQVHEMQMDGDVMKMGALGGGLEIPPGDSVALTPGGYHLMLLGLTSPFSEGDCVAVTLEFERAGAVPVVLGISGVAADAAPADAPAHGHEMPTEKD